MTPWLSLLVAAFATSRITHLIQVDQITARLRTLLTLRLPRGLSPLLTCPWCLGWWIAGIVVGVEIWAKWLPRSWPALLFWPAVAELAGLLRGIE